MKIRLTIGAIALGFAVAGCRTNCPNYGGELKDCDLTLSGIHFTRSLNGGVKLAVEKDGAIVMEANKGADYFIFPDPKDKPNANAGAIFTEIDNTKPFTFTARVNCGFSPEGVYNAAVMFLYVNDGLWQKICFEQDERGNHRIVTVRTVGTSDDNNHEVFNGVDRVYFKMSSDANTIAWYYSVDGAKWQRVRLYKNEYPGKVLIGLFSQAPQSDNCISTFEEVRLTGESVKDFWMGE